MVRKLPFVAFAITDLNLASEDESCVRVARLLRAAPRGSVAIALRDHEAPIRLRAKFGRRLAALARDAGALFFVHDRVDLALCLGAQGVQLGKRSLGVAQARRLLGNHQWIGCSCHNETELLRAHQEGADFAMLSPLFESPGKGKALGVETFARLRARVQDLAIVALGGIDEHNVRQALDARADAVALMRAWLCAKNIEIMISTLLAPFVEKVQFK